MGRGDIGGRETYIQIQEWDQDSKPDHSEGYPLQVPGLLQLAV